MDAWRSRRGIIAGVLGALVGFSQGPTGAKQKRRRKKRCNCTGQMFNLPSVAYDACCAWRYGLDSVTCVGVLDSCAAQTPVLHANPKSCRSCKRVINVYWACVEKPGALIGCQREKQLTANTSRQTP